MKSSDYHFVTRWRMPGTCEQVYAILDDPVRVSRFWPSLYQRVQIEVPGDPAAGWAGRRVAAETRGFLPYTLKWRYEVVRASPPHGFSLRAWGDLDGSGTWTFKQDGAFVDITYEWRVQGNKPLLRYLSFLLRPLFSWNHDHVMAKGERALRTELAAVAQQPA